MADEDLHAVLSAAADAVRRVLDDLDDWGLAGTRDGQYRTDLAADDACRSVVEAAGFGWFSEESGTDGLDREVVVVVDPIDGSTNASRGVPWFATSLCAFDAAGPRAALVVNQATGHRFRATRGHGADVDGRPLSTSSAVDLDDAIIGISGFPSRPLGWRQFRALGAVALDLCAVAAGVLDGYVDCSSQAHGLWDFAGGALICAEAGAVVVDAFGRSLTELDHAARWTPVAGATRPLCDDLVAARRSVRGPGDPPG